MAEQLTKPLEIWLFKAKTILHILHQKIGISVKLFKFIVMLILILITLRTGYLALWYKVEIATGSFLICLGITLLVACDGGLERKSKASK